MYLGSFSGEMVAHMLMFGVRTRSNGGGLARIDVLSRRMTESPLTSTLSDS